MEPITYYYDSINRNAILIKLKKPFFDWLNFIYPEDTITSIDEGTIYLINEQDSNEDIAQWLTRNYDNIFQNELNNWHTDEDDWPQKRSFKLFKDWFDYEIRSMVLDIEESEIIKE